VLHDLAQPGRDRAGLIEGLRGRHAVEGDDHSVRRRLTCVSPRLCFSASTLALDEFRHRTLV
jgi:hypothetical protein